MDSEPDVRVSLDSTKRQSKHAVTRWVFMSTSAAAETGVETDGKPEDVADATLMGDSE